MAVAVLVAPGPDLVTGGLGECDSQRHDDGEKGEKEPLSPAEQPGVRHGPVHWAFGDLNSCYRHESPETS